MSTSIKHQLAMISVESDQVSMEGLFTGFLGNVKDRLLAIKSKLRPSVTVATSISNELKAQIDTGNYLKVKSTPTTIPLHFKGDMLEYAKLINEALSICALVEPETLTPGKRHFLYLLGNPAQLQSLAPAATRKLIVSHTDRINQIKERIVNFHDPRGTATIVAFGDVYPNLNSFKETASVIDGMFASLNNDKRLDAIEISKSIDNIAGILDKLVIRIESEATTFSRNMDTTRDLAKLVFDMAEEAEFMSSVISIIHTLYSGTLLPSITMISNSLQSNGS